jgi:hypothetical protein
MILLIPIVLYFLILLIGPSATQRAKMEQQIKEEEEKLTQNFPYSMGWKDAIDIHNEAVAIVQARMGNKAVKKETREEKPTNAGILPSSTTTMVNTLSPSTTNSKTKKQNIQNQQVVKEKIAEKNQVKPTKWRETSIEQQIKEEDKLKQNFPYAMGWKDAIDNEAISRGKGEK